MRKALEKIYQIRRLRNEMRLAARAAGNKENIRRAAHMKMLASSAQTIPLWVGRDDEEPPELCGCIPANSDYIAEPVSQNVFTSFCSLLYLTKIYFSSKFYIREIIIVS